MRQGELGVTGPRRKVDNEEIKRAPCDVGHELLDHLSHDWPAPDHRCVLAGDESERHQFDAVVFERDDLSAHRPGLLCGAQHHGDVGPVDVGVEKADGLPLAREGDGQVHADRGFTHASLAAGNGHNMLDLGDGAGFRHAGWHLHGFGP